MLGITHMRSWGRDDWRGLDQIADIEIVRMGGATRLYALDGTDGTISAYDVTAGSTATLLSRHFVEGQSGGVAQRLLAAEADGVGILLAGGPMAAVRGYEIGGGGVGAERAVFATGAEAGPVRAMGAHDGTLLFAGTGGALAGLTDAGNGYAVSSSLSGDPLLLGAVTAIETIETASGLHVYAADGAGGGLTRAQLGLDGRLGAAATVDGDDGLWAAVPSDLAHVSVLGADYLVVADAGTHALTTMRIGQDGAPIAADTAYDDHGTRFANVTAIEGFSVEGRAFVAAGGSDGGFTVMEVLHSGTLREVATVIADGSASLGAIADIAVSVTGLTASLFVSGHADGGFSQFSLAFDPLGDILAAPEDGGRIWGASGADHLSGSDGDDALFAAGGADVLWDGAGADHLSGGTGRDVFVMAFDETRDVLLRYEQGQDVIDLSDWPLLYDTSRLTIEATGSGAQVTYFDETLRVVSMDRQPLTLTEADFIFA